MISKAKLDKAGKRWHAMKNSPNPKKHPKVSVKPYKHRRSKTSKGKKYAKRGVKAYYTKMPGPRLGKTLFGAAMKTPTANVGKAVYKHTPKKLLKSGLFGFGGMALSKMK